MDSLKEKYALLLSTYKNSKKPGWGKPAPQSTESGLTSDIVNLIVAEAIASRASDIHFEPGKVAIRVRFRIDGKLYTVLEVLENEEIHLAARIKIMCNIPTDTVSSRKSWDGRFSMNFPNHQYDFRIATFPTLLGEKIAIRVLNKNSELVDLKKIGLRLQAYQVLEQIIQRKSGLVLVSGPTGGGKTTTLYSILSRLNSPTVNIVTLENPVEYQIDGLNQCDINKRISEDFTSALKATLRQDPDIILIGEIRDQETAEIAMRASITGHLVLTSIHANSAIGTVARMINMGLERHMIAHSVIGAVSQYLVPRICDRCRVAIKIDFDRFNKICAQVGIDPKLFAAKAENEHQPLTPQANALQEIIFYKGTGCKACSGTGYLGMTGVFEVMHFTEDLRDAIANNASAAEIENMAVKKGYQSMVVDALQKVKSGIIHFDDIYHILLEKVR